MEQAIKHLQKDEILATIMREIPYPVIEKSDNL